MRLLNKSPAVKLATPILGAAILAAAGFAIFAWRADAARPVPPDAPPRPARVVEVAYHTGSRSLVLAGTVVPRIESTLGFRVAGKVVERVVDVGATLHAGDLIARLDPADYRLAVDSARAALASAHQAISSEDAALQTLGPVFAKLIQSDDAKESTRASQEHRAPVFRGI